jgi:type I restriction enzyme M protein
VPNGTLFADGVAARIKEHLLKEFNLHTIVRLPNGVFAPYTSIPTNLLFFEASGPTDTVWYYEQPLPEGRKQYTKTQPLRYEEFEPLLAWWGGREENERAWKVAVDEVLKYGGEGNLLSANLDLKNPRGGEDLEHVPPEKLVASIVEKEQQILALMAEIQEALRN